MWGALLGVACLLSASGCEPRDLPQSSYFDERVQPILSTSCVRQNSGCHLVEQGVAAGNLDLSSYDSLMRRDDVLAAYGPYPLPLFLMKPGDPTTIRVETFDPPDPSMPDLRTIDVTTDIRHAGGSTVDLGTSGFALIQQWTSRGHLRTGLEDRTLRTSVGDCSPLIRDEPGYDAAVADIDPMLYSTFVQRVQPVLRDSCAGSSCHGNEVADLYLSCGDDDAQRRWNYWIALQFLNRSSSESELLRRPLATLYGGTFHEGGNVFANNLDEGYRAIFEWAEAVSMIQPALLDPWVPPAADPEGYRYFVNRVEPVMVREGCMFLNCHSPSMFHDLRLRGGSRGNFGRIAMARNYAMALELLAVDAVSVDESRIVAKNLFPPEQVPGGHGLLHRGGSLFEDFGNNGSGPDLADPTDCAGIDAQNDPLDSVPSYCVFAEWHAIERRNAETRGELDPRALDSVVWVNRPSSLGRADEFDVYRPGATLMRASASLAADGSLTLGPAQEFANDCGLAPAIDLRGPAVSWDGSRIAFAARASADEPLRIYWMDRDGTDCEPAPGTGGPNSENGILIHDFDPVFTPDGRLVFASTRGNLSATPTGQAGPSRAPASLQPNANLYILEDGELRQLTYLLDQELAPSMMTDGRLIFTAEKRDFEFHQFAGRRQNLDGGDYHPLFAQRESVGFRSATEIVELLDRNLAVVAAPLDALDGAGHIAIVNRSIGPDQDNRDPADRSYIHSLRFPHEGGAFRSPAALPSGRFLASCDLDASNLQAGGFDFDLCEVDPDSGLARVIGGESGSADIEAVAVFARFPRGIFRSRLDEVNAATHIVPGASDAEVLVNDMPLLGTLLFANTRSGRPIDARVGGVDVLEVLAPPASASSFDAIGSDLVTDSFGTFYRGRRLLGHVPLRADGSARFRIRGGAPIQLRLTDASGAPLMFSENPLFTGEMVQREALQFYPGERSRQSIPRVFFNELCGGCHGSISGRELDIAAGIDVLTQASLRVEARLDAPAELGL